MKGASREVSLPLAAPLQTAAGTIQTREATIIRIEADDGEAVGYGEATPLPGWTESVSACRDAIEQALERLGEAGKTAALAATDGTPAARHGVSLALLDLAARRAGTPLYQHLGAERGAVDSLSVNATVGDGSVAATRDRALEAIEAGYQTIKLKAGRRSPDEDGGRLRAIREAVGEDVSLRVDANGAWSRESAERAIESFPRLEYLEQPLPATDLQGHASLRNRTPIAVDESLVEYSIDRIVEAGAADVVILKPMVLGGLDRAVSLAETARAAGVEPVVTTTIDGAIARTGTVHLAAALGIHRACGLATGDWLERDLAADPTTVADGTISVPRGPGTGVIPEWPAA